MEIIFSYVRKLQTKAGIKTNPFAELDTQSTLQLRRGEESLLVGVPTCSETVL